MGARGLQKAALVGILRGRYDIRLTDGGKAKKAAGMAVLRVGRGKASKMAALPQNGGAHAKEEEKPEVCPLSGQRREKLPIMAVPRDLNSASAGTRLSFLVAGIFLSRARDASRMQRFSCGRKPSRCLQLGPHRQRLGNCRGSPAC